MNYVQVTCENLDCLKSIVKEFRHQDITTEKALSFLQHPSIICYACMENDTAIGYIYAYRLPRMDNGHDIMQIYHLFVKEEHRRKGIGRTLMTMMLDYAKKEQLHYVLLLTGKDFIPARRLYESLGGYNHPEFKETYYWFITGQPQP